jgi:ferritin-like metal-binding protein YciE
MQDFYGYDNTIADANTGILDMLKEVQTKLRYPKLESSYRGHIGDTGRLKSYLQDILEYLR